MDPFSLGWHLPGLAVITAALLWLSVIDLRTKTLPRRIIYVAAALGLPWLIAASLVTSAPHSLLTMLMGAACGLVTFGTVHLITRGGFGAGDVRLGVLLGAVLGWMNPYYAPLGLLAGLTLAAVVGLILIVTGTVSRHDSVALGPFLSLGAIATVGLAGLTSVQISFGSL